MDFDLGASKNISNKVSDIDDLSNNDFHVHALEQEMKKIEAFKRELPHCMHLLNDAIERLKEESGREVVEELTLIKNYGEGDGRVKASNDFTENKNRMSSAQLFTPLSRNKDSVLHHRPRPGCDAECKFRNGGGAFLPFKKSTSSVVEEKHGTAAADSLSLAVSEGEKSDYEFGKDKLEKPHQQEQQKKLRRYWSPELHKIFVEALHQLGGAQKATPKQIREVMNVDGLTNDEVKSHLQKYRIHIKRAGEQLAITGPVHEEQPTL